MNVLTTAASGSILFDSGTAGGSTHTDLSAAVELSYDGDGGLDITSNVSGQSDRFNIKGDSSTFFSVKGSGNVGIGNTNPTANLEVGTLASGQTGNLVVNHDGGNTPAATFKGRTNKSIVQISDNDTIGYVSSENGVFSLGRNAGANAANININASNNVGIGTSSPTAKLHIAENSGQVRIGSPTTSYGGVGFASSLTTANAALWGTATTTNIGAVGSGSIEMKLGNDAGGNGSLKMEADKLYYTGGKLGIGTTSPDHELHVKGDITIDNESSSEPSMLHFNATNKANLDPSARINFWEGDSHTGTYTGSHAYIEYNGSTAGGGDGYLAIGGSTDAGANSDIMVINRLGRVGIGVASPGQKLDVAGNIAVTGTVDGRDVAADGSKLDGICPGAGAGTVTEVRGCNNISVTNGTTVACVSMSCGGAGAGTYGCTSDNIKIDTITLDAFGRVTCITTGGTGCGDITGVVAGTNLNGGATSGSATINLDGNVTGLTCLTVDDITVNGSLISNAGNGHLCVCGGGDIALDSSNGDIKLRDAGTDYGRFLDSSNNFIIQSLGNDKDIIFCGCDGGSAITALRLDMSDAGSATFSNYVNIPSSSLRLGGVAVTSTATELNLLDGFSSIPGACCLGDITAVVAGCGMTGGATSGSATLNICGGDGITAGSTAVSVDSTVVRTSGAQTIAGVKNFTSTICVAERISHTGTADTYMCMADDTFKFITGWGENLRLGSPDGSAVFNDGGQSLDFRVESNTNTHMLFVDGSLDCVGIGTSSPSARFDVKGSGTGANLAFRVKNSSDSDLLNVRDDGIVQVPNNYFYVNSSQGAYVQNALRVRGPLLNDQGTLSITGDVNFDSNTMFVDSTNNRVGIGCTSPTQKLAVAGTGLFTSDLTVQGDLTVTGDFTCLETTVSLTSAMDITNTGTGPALVVNQTGSNDIVDFRDDGTSAFYIEDGGNVGIGTTSPTAKLHIDDDANPATGLLVTGGAGGHPLATFTRDVGSTGTVAINASSGMPQIKLVASSNTFALGVNGSTFEIADNATIGGTNTRFSITNTGNVGIGTLTPGQKLDVAGNIAVTGTVDGRDVAADGSKLDGIACGATANTGDITAVTAGAGLFGGGTSGSVTICHNDTSSQSSVNNSSGTVIQDVTLDTYGHVTALGSTNLDSRYYMECEVDNLFLAKSGGTLTGTLNSRDIKLASGYHLQRSNHHSGHLEGSYNNIGDNAAKSNPIYSIGQSYNPNDATLGNMYGIGFSRVSSASFLNFTGASGWGLYVAADGDARVFLDGSNGIVASTGEHYVGSSRVFHDTYHPNADTLTSARTIALGGDVTGSASFNGGSNITISASLASGSVGASEIAANAVGSSEIATNAVTSAKIAADAVGSSEIAANAVGMSEIANDAVGSGQILADAVGSSEIAANAVGASEIAASAVGASELNVCGNGTTAQFLRSDGDGTFTWATPTVPTNNNQLTNGAGYTTCTGDITAVVAGTDLTGGATSGSATLCVTSATASTASTIVKRNSSGDINVRLLRSEYDSTNSNIGFIMTQVNTASDNYVRPSTMAQVRTCLNVANGATACTGTTTASNSQTFTNKSGCISQWTNNSGYTTCTGTVSNLGNLGITATATELNYTDGVSSNIQTQLNGKLSTSGCAANSQLLDGINSTSFLRSDATDTATGALTLSNDNNTFNGHHFFSAYDSVGNHYPHYLHGCSSGSAKVNIRVYCAGGGSFDTLYVAAGSNNITWRGNTMWNAANDGSGSGLDADKLDGVQGSSFLRSDTADSFTGTLTMGTQKALVANNYGRGVYGLYSSTKFQHVWSMGTAYNVCDDGSGPGNLYGLAFTHTNAGGQSKANLSHQLLVMHNGATCSAIGSGIWTNGVITSNTGQIVLCGTGRIQGVDTVSSSTDAANKSYVDTQVATKTSCTGTTTASNSQTFTNKGGNISQWTNNSGYTTCTGNVVTAGTTFTGNVALNDNVCLRIGSSADLSLFHNGNHSYIDNDKNSLYIRNNVDGDDGGDIYIMPHDNENGIIIYDDSRVDLYFDNTSKFCTQCYGTRTTGTVCASYDVKAPYVCGTSCVYGYYGKFCNLTTGGQGINTNWAITAGNCAGCSCGCTSGGSILALGNVSVCGTLAKSSGCFDITHPLPALSATKRLSHSFVESPQADNIYSGVVQLTGGSASVNIDEIHGMTSGTLTALNRCFRTFTTNETNWDPVRGSVTDNTLTIESCVADSTATVSWMVLGERHDPHMLSNEHTDNEGRARVEYEPPTDIYSEGEWVCV